LIFLIATSNYLIIANVDENNSLYNKMIEKNLSQRIMYDIV